MRSFSVRSGPWAALGLGALLAACADARGGPPGGGAALDKERLLEDQNLFGDGDVSADRVQQFLASKGSALAGYAEGGRSAAQWVVDEARADGVSPIYVLARIQTESGLVRGGSLGRVDAAAGCGCPDGEACDPELAGFARQIDCAARLVRSYADDLDARGETVSGWAVGRERQTLDGCSVAPTNRATAALYTYTPWVGAYAEGCGDSNVGGSSLVALLYRQYAAEIAPAPPAPSN